jgi:hypothetical protein
MAQNPQQTLVLLVLPLLLSQMLLLRRASSLGRQDDPSCV